LIYTVTRSNGAAPKVRYNLLDVGGTISYTQLANQLKLAGVEINQLAKTHSHLPILFTCGRSDLTVSFYGANIYPAEISEIIQGQPALKQQIHSFQLACTETERVDARLKITLELLPDLTVDRLSIESLRDFFWQALAQSNQDFREVTKMFDRQSIEIAIQSYGTGVFRSRNSQTKHQYVAGR
jgi:phenylacetate-CoA ligase